MNKVATELEESYLLSRFQVTCGLGDHCSTSLGHLWAFCGFLWLLDCSQVDYWLRDHFATTVAHLFPKCALSVYFSFKYFCLYNNGVKIFGVEGVLRRRFENMESKMVYI